MPNTFDIGTLGMQAAGGAIGAGMGLLLEHHNDKRQIEQQQRLTDIQTTANKDMARFNYDQQMKMWHDTNYKAQMDELEKAGLNPALIYGEGGGGGATVAAAQAQGASSGTAPQGGREIMELMNKNMEIEQMALLKAQRDKTQAETDEIRSRVPVNQAQVPNINASTANLTEGIKTQQAEQALKQAQADLTRFQTKLGGATFETVCQTAEENLSKLKAESEIAQRQNSVDASTLDTRLKTIAANYTRLLLENGLTRANITNTNKDTQLKDEQIKAIVQEVANGIQQIKMGWMNLSYKGIESDEAAVQKAKQEMQEWMDKTNVPQQFKETIEEVMKVIILGEVMGGKGNRTQGGIGFKPQK